MTILLYEYCTLEERASRHLKAWKACHLVLYALAGVFGILNYIFLQNTMQLVDNNCVIYPRELAFRTYEPSTNSSSNTIDAQKKLPAIIANAQKNDSDIIASAQKNESAVDASETEESTVLAGHNVAVNIAYIHIVIMLYAVDADDDGPRVILDTTRTLFAYEADCQFAEYMPIMSSIFAAAWVTMFTMCPGGGHSRSGLHQPWRILAPALVFSLVLVGLTGHSFARTSGGLHAFCSAFYNVTNATDCASASAFVQRSWGAAWGLSARADSTRAASAASCAAWTCAAALCLARCLLAPDFEVRATRAHLKDPQRKLTPYLKKQRRTQPSPVSPSKRDTISVRSEPTMTTELVTASIEQGQETAPPSLQATPVRRGHKADDVMELKTVSVNDT